MNPTTPHAVPALPGDSRYTDLVGDLKALWGAVQDRVHEGGSEGEDGGLVAAITLHPPRAVVVYIEYGEDMAYPQLRLLDLRTDDIVCIDSDGLADSPLIDGIAFQDADAGLLELQFRDGDTHTVTIDFDKRVVRW